MESKAPEFRVVFIINIVSFFFNDYRSDGSSSETPTLVEGGEAVGQPHSPHNKVHTSHNHNAHVNSHGSQSHHHDKSKQAVKYGELVILG